MSCFPSVVIHTQSLERRTHTSSYMAINFRAYWLTQRYLHNLHYRIYSPNKFWRGKISHRLSRSV